MVNKLSTLQKLFLIFSLIALISYCIIPFIKNAPTPKVDHWAVNWLDGMDIKFEWWQYTLAICTTLIPILYIIFCFKFTLKATKVRFFILSIIGVVIVAIFVYYSIDNIMYYYKNRQLSFGEKVWNFFSPDLPNRPARFENTQIAFLITTILFLLQYILLLIFGAKLGSYKRSM